MFAMRGMIKAITRYAILLLNGSVCASSDAETESSASAVREITLAEDPCVAEHGQGFPLLRDIHDKE